MADVFKTLFDGAVLKSNNEDGDWGGTKNGDKSFQGADAAPAAKSRVNEVTYPDIGGVKPGDKVGESGGGVIANKK